MRIAELLNSMAAWLESPNNEALLLSEQDEKCMEVVANSCTLAAALLKSAAEEVDSLEPVAESMISPESLDEIAALASALDESGDPALKKQASVLDELLLSIASPPDVKQIRQKLEDSRLEDLKKKYEAPREELKEESKIAESEKAVEKSDYTKKYRLMEAPLSTRYCPDHAGVQMARIGEHVWQCELDKKIYDFEAGFDLNNGSKVPGGDVSHQTDYLNTPYHAIFDSRDQRLSSNN